MSLMTMLSVPVCYTSYRSKPTIAAIRPVDVAGKDADPFSRGFGDFGTPENQILFWHSS